ncbi:MAG: hypothetical protein AXA67_11800 [Methylothermaceae bacteria B42]|nr:MAG: hypothetical protein AXA67_11800 [Methylothermaceae bacteria B42]HHJ39215.1 hydrogenase accessory protein HypB [Methylothermaceae bacterium]
MCATCGCSDHNNVRIARLDNANTATIYLTASPKISHGHGHEHHHHHCHPSGHNHHHSPPQERTINLEAALLAKNDQLARQNRDWLQEQHILALNLVSSPGAGKTTLLERTLRDLGDTLSLSVIEGDQETANDAQRIRSTGCRVIQINTGAGCHLDAEMIANALEKLAPPAKSIVMIENVGNLVCPALFDLGEQSKVVILSVTEGEDKPIKYPHMFRAARLMLINKIDLLPYVDFDVAQCIQYARSVNPDIQVLLVSATKGEGLDKWYKWIRKQITGNQSAARE